MNWSHKSILENNSSPSVLFKTQIKYMVENNRKIFQYCTYICIIEYILNIMFWDYPYKFIVPFAIIREIDNMSLNFEPQTNEVGIKNHDVFFNINGGRIKLVESYIQVNKSGMENWMYDASAFGNLSCSYSSQRFSWYSTYFAWKPLKLRGIQLCELFVISSFILIPQWNGDKNREVLKFSLICSRTSRSTIPFPYW